MTMKCEKRQRSGISGAEKQHSTDIPGVLFCLIFRKPGDKKVSILETLMV